jgi:hypothetical protein
MKVKKQTTFKIITAIILLMFVASSAVMFLA